MPKTILISACLVGLQTRYDGQVRSNAQILEFIKQHRLIPVPVCPEQLAGLPTPRPCTCFTRGNGEEILEGCGEMVDSNGKRMNEIFIRGAEETLKIAELSGCKTALFKERSPSCGVHRVYLKDKVTPGCGVTSALLNKKGFKIFCEEELDKLIYEMNYKTQTVLK